MTAENMKALFAGAARYAHIRATVVYRGIEAMDTPPT
jgi:hypothetical protein